MASSETLALIGLRIICSWDTFSWILIDKLPTWLFDGKVSLSREQIGTVGTWDRSAQDFDLRRT